MNANPGPAPLPARPAAVAGTFYPGRADELAAVVDELLATAATNHPIPPGLEARRLAGILVPHAGLAYSGLVAAAAWRLISVPGAAAAPTVVLLGTNHGAAWLDGVGAWDGGPWRTPAGEVMLDRELTEAVLGLGPPFAADRRCHIGEHSLEVQLPLLARVAPEARIVALSVGTGTGQRAIDAGARLGRLLAQRRSEGAAILLAISSDMAHYPAEAVAERVTADLLPYIIDLDPAGLARAEVDVTGRQPGVSCGMCGIEPAVLGLAALRAMAEQPGVSLAEATSAAAGGDPHRTVGYLAVAFESS